MTGSNWILWDVGFVGAVSGVKAASAMSQWWISKFITFKQQNKQWKTFCVARKSVFVFFSVFSLDCWRTPQTLDPWILPGVCVCVAVSDISVCYLEAHHQSLLTIPTYQQWSQFNAKPPLLHRWERLERGSLPHAISKIIYSLFKVIPLSTQSYQRSLGGGAESKHNKIISRSSPTN